MYYRTTGKRAKKIFENNKLRCNVNRYYTSSKSGDGYTKQGYIYLANEMMFIYFANCCDIKDKSGELFIFKIKLDDSILEHDYDAIWIQPNYEFVRNKYSDNLDYSLNEFKSCRIKYDIKVKADNVSYLVINKSDVNIRDLIVGAKYNFQDVKSAYNAIQRKFIKDGTWKTV